MKFIDYYSEWTQSTILFSCFADWRGIFPFVGFYCFRYEFSSPGYVSCIGFFSPIFFSFSFYLIFSGGYQDSSKDLQIFLNSVLSFFNTNPWRQGHLRFFLFVAVSCARRETRTSPWKTLNVTVWKSLSSCRILQGFQTLEMRTGIWVASKIFYLQEDTWIQLGGKGWVLDSEGSPSLATKEISELGLGKGRWGHGGG